jgi:hypothetical protein
MSAIVEELRRDSASLVSLAESVARIRVNAENFYGALAHVIATAPHADAELLEALDTGDDEPNAITAINRYLREHELYAAVLRREALRLARLYHDAKQRRGDGD